MGGLQHIIDRRVSRDAITAATGVAPETVDTSADYIGAEWFFEADGARCSIWNSRTGLAWHASGPRAAFDRLFPGMVS